MLRPFVGDIQQEQAERDSLMTVIQERQEQLAAKHTEKSDQWQNFRVQFAQQQPRVSDKAYVQTKSVPEMKALDALSKKEIEKCVADIEPILLKKIDHA